MANLFKLFKQILPGTPLLVGDVLAADGEVLTVELLGGGIMRARGKGGVGQRVFVRDGAVEGQAPSLPLVEVEV